jgi:hypothetical protein
MAFDLLYGAFNDQPWNQREIFVFLGLLGHTNT